MKKVLLWAIGALGVVFVLALLGLLGRDVFLRKLAQTRLEQRTGFRAEIGALKTSLSAPTLHLRDLKLYNGPEFGGSLLLEIPECFIELDSYRIEGKLHLKQLRLNVAQLNVIRDKNGRFNLETLEREFQEPDQARSPGRTNRPAAKIEFAGIDRVQLTIGQIKFTDWQKPSRSRVIEVGLRDEVITSIKTEADLEEWIGSQLFRLIIQELSRPDRKGRGGRVEIRMDPDPAPGSTNEVTPSP